MRSRPFLVVLGVAALVCPLGSAASAATHAGDAVAPDVESYGQAANYGSTNALTFNQPIVGLARTANSRGYWEAASDGAVFSFGNAGYFGSMGGVRLNQPIVGIAATRSGKGYWLVASDGGVFSFGDARFLGSMGGVRLNQPIVGIAATQGKGYWLVASDGGVFTFGNARFLGNPVGTAGSIVGLAPTRNGDGYWMADAPGHVFAFGRAPGLGDSPATGLGFTRPVVGITATGDGVGYWLVRRGTPGAFPGPVWVIKAGHGGGSGEIQLNWNAVAGANGYRVARATSPTGPFSVTADINVTTGKTTTAGLPIDTPGSVIDIRSDRQGFFPPSRATPVPAMPSRYFYYTDIVTLAGPRSYYTVTAYNAFGDGPPSVVVCGSPGGYPAC